ncbi:hypothetical protein SLE2022_221930 [Rubroshorea leprosula]
MADGLILGPVIDATLSRVIVVASEQINPVWGWKDDLKRLRLIMSMLGGVLQGVDEEHMTVHFHLQAWLEELRAVAVTADDMLEDVANHNLRRQVAFQKSNWKKVSYLFTLSNHHPLVFRLRMANKVKNLHIHLADICDWATRLGLKYKIANTTVPMPIVNQHTHSFLAPADPSKVVGRREEVDKIVGWLTDYSSKEEALSVISIWGMPGLGKTTLAKAVCANEKIKKYFGKNIMWVSVSVNFDVERILGEMLESLTGTRCTLKNNSTLLKEIGGGLEKREKEEKSYLLILDDVRNEKSGKWDELRHCLLSICKNPRNGVVVTTRSKKVASTMGTRKERTLHLGQLKGDECWDIIKERAFGNAFIYEELKEIGEKIGEKCGGSPLVAAILGGSLCNKRDKGDWLSVESKIGALSSLEDQHGRILHALQLNFDQLPKLALKRCFAFCSIFPRTFVMKKDVLIQLWMAEGYLQPSIGNSMEDMGNKYINYLLSYSLFLEEERDDLGNVQSCKMHDFVHDLVKSVSKFESMIFKGGSGSNVSGFRSKVSISDQVQHLNLIDGVPTNLGDVASKLCTLFSNHGFSCSTGATKFERLRVLSFCGASDAKQLPTCFGNSKNLRFLDISGTEIEELPNFITKLYKLQTFRFMDCRSLKMPPRGLGDLINLRHIYFNDEERMPANLGRLTNLQTLPLFFVGTTKGCKIEELGSLRGLEGRLEIHKLELVKGKSEAEKAKLHEKAVKDLSLHWKIEGNQDNDEDVLEGLQPHSNLRRLWIDGYGGSNLASWMLESSEELSLVNNLVELRISYCSEITSFGDGDGDGAVLTSMYLKKLSIVECTKLKGFLFIPSLEGLECLPSGLSSHTALEELQIGNCSNLVSIPEELKQLRSLVKLGIRGCEKLKYIPSLERLVSLKSVSIWGCNGLECLPSGLSACIALEELQICRCSNLVSIPEELKQLGSLIKLGIWECGKLRRFPEEILGSLASLKALELGPFSEELQEFPNLSSTSSLEVLRLRGWGELLTLPHQIQRLTALGHLTITSFNGVEEALLGNLSCLKTLTIRDCTRVGCLLGGLPSLEELEITECPNLVSFQRELKELHSLTVVGCRQFVGFLEESLGCCTRLKRSVIGRFSEELEEFPSLSSIHASLEDLTLRGWEKLTDLPQIQHLTALKELTIWDFSGMESLPDWFNNLSSLHRVEIWSCPNKLKERCTKGSGPDWPKISHIPYFFTY